MRVFRDVAAMKGTTKALYQAWLDMRYRCNSPKCPSYFRYGGRGIKVDPRWNSYDCFSSDMGPHPGKGWTLDRINNNQGYRPGNCRWATRKTQSRNMRSNKLTQAIAASIRQRYFAGKNQLYPGNARALAEEYGVARETIYGIIYGQRRA